MNSAPRLHLRPFLALLLALAALACSGAPTPTAPGLIPVTPVQVPVAPDAQLPVDPRVAVGRLDNGLTYYVRRNASPEERAELWLVVDAGSILEDDDQRGLAHFVEHMAFNGTRRFERQELVSYLESIGMRFGPDVNASTGFDETIYTLRVPTDERRFLERGLDILEDWAGGITFDPEEVDQERGVLVEEWRLGRGAGSRLIEAQAPVLFAGSRYAERLPIGSKEVLETAPLSALTRFYRDWYRPDLMAVIAVGDFDPRRVEREVRERFADLSGPPDSRERPLLRLPEHEETLFATFTDPELTGTSVSVYTKLPRRPQGTVGDYRQSLVETLYHRMINDRLYEVGHRPDPPFLYAYSDSDALVRAGEVDQQEAGVEEGRVLEGLEGLLTEIERVHRFGFTETELERNKLDLLRAYERTYVERAARTSSSYAAEYSRAFLEDEPIPGIRVEVEIARREIPGIGLDEVNALADLRTSAANRVILVSAQASAAESLPSEDQLLAVWERVRERPLEPYEDAAPRGGLMAAPPEPGEIVERREIPEIGVTEWRLSNGVRVVLKPTDFREDEVLLEGWSPGGHSLVPDEEHLSASWAAEIVSLGGLGELDEIALAKALAGTVAQVGPYIGELEEGVSAGGSAEDLETIFQLVHLALTQPRLDPEAVRSFKERLRPSLENRLASPQQAFVEEMFEALSMGHPRRRPLTPERLDEIDPELALEVYQQRFADLSDATFVLVGTFEPAAVEVPVRTYLASLPGLPDGDRAETWRDVGLERPDEPVELTVERGLEPRASVWLILHGEPPPFELGPGEGAAATYRERVHGLHSLAEALEIRLREVMREDLGATYGVSVGVDLLWRPRQRYSVSIQFGCAPEAAEGLVARVREVIETFREEGPPAELAARVREIQTRHRQTQVRENGFWLAALGGYYRRGEDPRAIFDFHELVETVTPERLREAARAYLDWDRRVLGVLFPEPADEEPKPSVGRASGPPDAHNPTGLHGGRDARPTAAGEARP